MLWCPSLPGCEPLTVKTAILIVIAGFHFIIKTRAALNSFVDVAIEVLVIEAPTQWPL